MKNLILSSLVVAICMLFGTNVFAQTIAPGGGRTIKIVHGTGNEQNNGGVITVCPEDDDMLVCAEVEVFDFGYPYNNLLYTTPNHSDGRRVAWDGLSKDFWLYSGTSISSLDDMNQIPTDLNVSENQVQEIEIFDFED